VKQAARVVVPWIPAVLTAALAIRFYVDVPFADIWDWLDRHYPLAGEAGALTRYWWPFNDSRVFLALVIDRVLVGPTHMNMAVRAALKIPVAFMTALLLIRMARRTSASPPGVAVEFALVAAAWPLASWPMWIDPRLFSAHLSILLVVAAVSSATRAVSGRAFWTAIAWGVAASLTYIHGSLAWPALLAGLWLAGQGTRRAWPAAIALVLALELWHVIDVLRLGAGLSAAPGAVVSPVEMARAGLGVLGAPLAYGRSGLRTSWAVVVGAVGLATMFGVGLATWRDPVRRRRALPWLMIAAWAITNVAAMAAGRTKFGAGVVFTDRYVPLTAMFWGALVGLGSVWLARPFHGWRARVTRPAGFAAGLVLALAWGLASWDAIAGPRLTALAARLSVGRTCLAAWPDVDDECLELLYPNARRARAILTHVAPRNPSFLRPEASTPMPVHLRRVAPALAWPAVRIVSPVAGDTFVDVLAVGGEAWGPVIFQHPPSVLTWSMTVPDAGEVRIETGARVNTPAWPDASRSDGVLFEVRVLADGTSTSLWRRAVAPAVAHERFVPISLDLSPWRGRVVELSMVTSAGDSPSATPAHDWAVWLYPELITRHRGGNTGSEQS
jgi:hypothetical protein